MANNWQAQYKMIKKNKKQSIKQDSRPAATTKNRRPLPLSWTLDFISDVTKKIKQIKDNPL